jgi:ferredoxin
MMQAVEQAAESAHIKVHLERFSALPIDTGQDNNFQVEISSTGAVYTIEEDDSIIDVLLEEGIEVDYSCLEGVCGACITAVIEGSVEHRDSILSEKEQVSNKMMCVCVSRASSAKLVLDL